MLVLLGVSNADLENWVDSEKKSVIYTLSTQKVVIFHSREIAMILIGSAWRIPWNMVSVR